MSSCGPVRNPKIPSSKSPQLTQQPPLNPKKRLATTIRSSLTQPVALQIPSVLGMPSLRNPRQTSQSCTTIPVATSLTSPRPSFQTLSFSRIGLCSMQFVIPLLRKTWSFNDMPPQNAVFIPHLSYEVTHGNVYLAQGNGRCWNGDTVRPPLILG